VAAADVADRVSHRQNGQAECEGNSKQPNADLWKCRGEYRAAAPTEDKPECTDKLGGRSTKLRHGDLLK
jgi:hypothetical protein